MPPAIKARTKRTIHLSPEPDKLTCYRQSIEEILAAIDDVEQHHIAEDRLQVVEVDIRRRWKAGAVPERQPIIVHILQLPGRQLNAERTPLRVQPARSVNLVRRADGARVAARQLSGP